MKISTITYDTFMLPLELLGLKNLRKQLLSTAHGDVLEVGIGTGVNLKYLPQENISSYVGMDLESKNLNFPRHETHFIDYKFIDANVESLPFGDNHFDTIIFTLVFCSVHDPEQGFSELYRVLKPNGRLIFIEHILPKNPLLRRIFHKITPYWLSIADNCHLNRDTIPLIASAGFRLKQQHYYMNGIIVGGIASK